MSVSVGIHEAKTNFSALVSRAAFAGERFIVQRHGKPMAAIISLKELQMLEELERQADLEHLNQAIATSEGTVPFESVFEQYATLFGEKLVTEPGSDEV